MECSAVSNGIFKSVIAWLFTTIRFCHDSANFSVFRCSADEDPTTIQAKRAITYWAGQIMFDRFDSKCWKVNVFSFVFGCEAVWSIGVDIPKNVDILVSPQVKLVGHLLRYAHARRKVKRYSLNNFGVQFLSGKLVITGYRGYGESDNFKRTAER